MKWLSSIRIALFPPLKASQNVNSLSDSCQPPPATQRIKPVTCISRHLFISTCRSLLHHGFLSTIRPCHQRFCEEVSLHGFNYLASIADRFPRSSTKSPSSNSSSSNHRYSSLAPANRDTGRSDYNSYSLSRFTSDTASSHPKYKYSKSAESVSAHIGDMKIDLEAFDAVFKKG
jgi:hypothetical protein